jgi:hypothetical protein
LAHADLSKFWRHGKVMQWELSSYWDWPAASARAGALSHDLRNRSGGLLFAC